MARIPMWNDTLHNNATESRCFVVLVSTDIYSVSRGTARACCSINGPAMDEAVRYSTMHTMHRFVQGLPSRVRFQKSGKITFNAMVQHRTSNTSYLLVTRSMIVFMHVLS